MATNRQLAELAASIKQAHQSKPENQDYLEYRVKELERLLALADENLAAMCKEPGAVVHPYAYVDSVTRFRIAKGTEKP